MWSRLSLTCPEQMEEKPPESCVCVSGGGGGRASRESSGDKRHVITHAQIPGAPADDLTGWSRNIA